MSKNKQVIIKTLPEGKLTEDNYELIESELPDICLLYTSPSPRDRTRSRMPSSA